MDRNQYEMAVTLIKALEQANNDDRFASCRDGIYGDLQAALGRIPGGALLHDHHVDTGSILELDDLQDRIRYELAISELSSGRIDAARCAISGSDNVWIEITGKEALALLKNASWSIPLEISEEILYIGSEPSRD